MKHFEDSRLLAFSLQIYRGLTLALPKDFRDDHGADMSQVFRDCCRDAHRQNGNAGVLGELCAGVFDLFLNALKEQVAQLAGDPRRRRELVTISLAAMAGGAYAAFAAAGGYEVPGPVYMVVVFAFTLAFLRPSAAWLTGLLVAAMPPLADLIAADGGPSASFPIGDAAGVGTFLALVSAVSGSVAGAISRGAVDRVLTRFDRYEN